jgi:diguanylate cyclase (GGDEF)-like protein
MPSLLARLLLALTCLCACPTWAANSAPLEPVLLGDGSPSFEVTSDIQTWIDTNSKATIEAVALSPKNFTSGLALTRHPLSDKDTLWIKLYLLRPPGNSAEWHLTIPLPFLDSATLYQPNATGGWSVQTAGDTIAQANWNKRWLYPEFDLSLTTGATQVVYLRVRNFKHVSIPLRLATKPEREYQRILEVILLGLLLGALVCLSLLSVVRYLEHGEFSDIWASLYGLLITLTVAQINGVLNVFLWASVPDWGNYAYAIMPLIAMGAALLFVRDLYALSTHFHRYEAFLSAVGWGTIASVLLYAVMPRSAADKVSYIILLTATVIGLGATGVSWLGGSSIWRWLMLAYMPQFLGLSALMAEALGWVPTMWEMRYITSACVALSVPVLVYALSRATHDRKELEVRANHLPTQDALTGLLTREVFQSHLDDAVQRSIEHREPISLVLVHIINHAHIRQSLGDPVAEQSLLRAVVKLHRILRDVDPAGRVGTAYFALLLDGVATRQTLTERMVQLIASGLIPLPGLYPPVTLQFHAACVLLHENPVAPETALPALEALLASMSPHTRRPIRFLEPEPTQAAALQSELSPT